MQNVNRVSELEVEEDGWDGMFYHAGELFMGLTYAEHDGALKGETWYRDGLQSGWSWEIRDRESFQWVGHNWENLPHGEMWRHDLESRLLRWSVWEYGLPVQAKDYSIDGSRVTDLKMFERSLSAVEACRARAGIEGETDPLIYPLRGPNFDTRLIIQEFFEPYR